MAVKRSFLLLLLCFLSFVFLRTATPLRAQADTAPTEFGDATLVTESEDLTAQLQQVTEEYFTAVEAYRDAEERFLISREQYYQLNTLAAQDDVIRRGQEVLQARSAALRLYYTYLNLTVKKTKGIDLNDKNEVVTRLEDAIRQLQAYEGGISVLDTRAKIDQHFQVFNNLKNTYYHAAYTALAVIKMGEIQTAIDTSSIAATDFKDIANNADISAAEKAVKQRGFEEIDRLLQRSKNNLITQREQFLRFNVSGNYNESGYRQFQTDAEFSYTQLRQALNFLKEVASGL